MKLKEQKKFGILWLSIGAALFLAGLLLGETEYSSYISGFGGALLGVGAARLLRVDAGDPGVRSGARGAGALRPDLLAGAALHRILLAL